MSNWASPADVTARWIGPGAPTNTATVQAILDDAEAVILAEYPRIQERIDAETLPVETVRLVVVRMATRLLRNPENLNYWQQSTGPFGQARNFGDRVDIWLSSDERALLAPRGRGRAFSVDLAPNATAPAPDLPVDETTTLWRRA